jgi:hypothetical protein
MNEPKRPAAPAPSSTVARVDPAPALTPRPPAPVAEGLPASPAGDPQPSHPPTQALVAVGGLAGARAGEQVTLNRVTYDWMVNRLTFLGELPPKEPLLLPATVPPPIVSSSPSDSPPNYRFHLRGTFAKDGEHAAIITNGVKVWRIELQLLQFLTLLVLASFARREAGLDAPLDVRGGEFLQPRRIALEIARLKTRERDLQDQIEGFDLLLGPGSPPLEVQAKNLDRQPVYQAWYGIGERFAEQRLEHLLEGRRHSGYRILVPPQWIKITLFDEDGSQTWG